MKEKNEIKESDYPNLIKKKKEILRSSNLIDLSKSTKVISEEINKYKLYKSKSKGLVAVVNSRYSISVTEDLVESFSDYPQIFSQMYSHEIAHIENGDLKSEWKIFNRHKRYITIINECYADIRGKEIYNLTNDEVMKVFQKYKKHNKERRWTTHALGYLTYYERYKMLISSKKTNEVKDLYTMCKNKTISESELISRVQMLFYTKEDW